MLEIFEASRREIASKMSATVEDIPYHEVRTPLQSAIQILKRHRDEMFSNRPNEKPISIILTTLAAHAYQQESTISDALFSILSRMDQFIENRNGLSWISNPTDPTENFADRWHTFPERGAAFYEWLGQVRTDFNTAAQAVNREMAMEALVKSLGRNLLNTANQRRYSQNLALNIRYPSRVGVVLNPVHRLVPPWKSVNLGAVRIERATIERNGFRTEEFQSNGRPIPKRISLVFKAVTNVSKPFKVY